MSSVLIVDDEEAIRRLIRETLEQAGYHVHEASDGKEGLARYRQSPADLVIMDILMPDQDGLESILTLRREFPKARIVAITGGSDMIGILNFLDVARMLGARRRSEEHTSELQSPKELVCRLLLEKKQTAGLRSAVIVAEPPSSERWWVPHRLQ